ncbi:HMA2 domain-containing protein [Helicobacter pullorum]|uniref:Uncharacterized protein n=2 Tax=Helicobacter pullorum TaxID=35818 RepID=A0A377Q0I8_9HELI|nr:hypothetical protein [Helicobacter pullorum]STQ88738.1 Uncharacterised protein [Helicobacter pullorum]HJF83933.1 hypothetical protein [Helicobacter pullorum]
MSLGEKSLIQNYSITPQDLEMFAEYFSIIHHIDGRIRLRASAKLKKFLQENDTINPFNILEAIEASPAIKSIKFNKIIGSLTIQYDTNLFEPIYWESCIKGERLEEIAQKINLMIKEIG